MILLQYFFIWNHNLYNTETEFSWADKVKKKK